MDKCLYEVYYMFKEKKRGRREPHTDNTNISKDILTVFEKVSDQEYGNAINIWQPGDHETHCCFETF